MPGGLADGIPQVPRINEWHGCDLTESPFQKGRPPAPDRAHAVRGECVITLAMITCAGNRDDGLISALHKALVARLSIVYQQRLSF